MECKGQLDLDATFTALTLMIGGPYAAGDPEADKNTRELTDAEQVPWPLLAHVCVFKVD